MKPVTREEALELLAPQPDPVGGEGDMMMELAAAYPLYASLFLGRREQGIARYGKPLQRGNGRDQMADAVQEAVDGMGYMRQIMGDETEPDEDQRLAARALFRFMDALDCMVELHRLRRARGAE